MSSLQTKSRFVSVADTAKLVRAELKAKFPDSKFRVKSSSYAGGASIDINYFDGPRHEEVKDAVSPFVGATFDGMTDSMDYHRHTEVNDDGDLETVHYGADFIFVTRNFTEESMLVIVEYVAEYYDLEGRPTIVGRSDYSGAYLDDSDDVRIWEPTRIGSDWRELFYRESQNVTLEATKEWRIG